MTELRDTADQDRVAALLVENTRRTLVIGVGLAVLAFSDLVTGSSLLNNWRIDVALLAAAALIISTVYSRQRLAARFRRGEMRGPVPLRARIRFGLSEAMFLVFVGAIGYLLGGWTVAIVLPAALLATIAVALGIGLRRRRHRRA